MKKTTTVCSLSILPHMIMDTIASYAISIDVNVKNEDSHSVICPSHGFRVKVGVDPGSVVAQDANWRLLELIGKALSFKELINYIFELQGHTDSIGPEQYNLILSKRRAERVEVSGGENGIPAGRLIVKGCGQDRPVADNDTKEGVAMNRRVEINKFETKSMIQPD